MPKVSFKLGEFRRFSEALPADMPAIAALKAFLIARGAVNVPGRLAVSIRRPTKRVKKR